MSFFFLLLCSFASAQGIGRRGPYGSNGANLKDPQNWLAIVGDSGVTGAASAADLEPTLSNLTHHLRDSMRPNATAGRGEEHLTRVLYSRAEFETPGGLLNAILLNAAAKLSLQLDVPENSFGYLLGRQLGIAPANIVLVGQDGVRVKTIGAQFARIFEMNTRTLPPLVLVSYTANDFCDERVFAATPGAWATEFKIALEQSWAAAEPHLIAHARGTRVVVLAPFDVVNVITNPDLLSQKVNVEGQGEITCGQLRHGETHFTLAAWLVLRMLNLMCPSVTQTHLGDAGHLEHLRAVQDAFSEAWKTQVAALNLKYARQGIQFIYFPQVRKLQLAAGDLGHDCFHPSRNGSAKLSEMLRGLLRGPQGPVQGPIQSVRRPLQK